MEPANQTGFREEMMDNIYVVNYLVNRQLEIKKRKLTIFFVDLRTTFDTVDRGTLIRGMRERRIREGLTIRIKKIMREPRS